jgi:hypothetical protein
MKRRKVAVDVSDHAVLRWLERSQGLDVEAVRAMIAGKVMSAAELQACAVVVEKVRFILREQGDGRPGVAYVLVSTTVNLDQRRGLGLDDGRYLRFERRGDD